MLGKNLLDKMELGQKGLKQPFLPNEIKGFERLQ